MTTMPGSNSAKSSFSVPVRKFESSELSIIRQIGDGTTSIVSLAVSNGLPVAVKTLKKEQDVSDVATRKQMKSDFANELSINLCLRHPNIIMLLGCLMMPAPSSNLKSLVFEYCNGGTLNCESHRSTKLSSTLKISIGVARALCHAHAMGIMHRDVKPSQVVLTRPSHLDEDDDYFIENARESDGDSGNKDGKGTSQNQSTSSSLGIPKLGDWGLATFCNDSKSLHGQTGTLEFVSLDYSSFFRLGFSKLHSSNLEAFSNNMDNLFLFRWPQKSSVVIHMAFPQTFTLLACFSSVSSALNNTLLLTYI